MQTRVEETMTRHDIGYNCAQAVACTYCDLFGIDEKLMFRLTEALGGGMGGKEGTCGAVSGACVLAGMKASTGNLEKPDSKAASYELSKEILKKGKEDNEGGIKFIADELNLTQHIIEDIIQPRLILVKNKESWAYWGKLKDDGLIWMGYEFEKIKDFASGELELYIITGLLNSDKRIAQEFNSENTHVKGCYVLFAKHINQYVSKEKRPTAELLNNILNNIY